MKNGRHPVSNRSRQRKKFITTATRLFITLLWVGILISCQPSLEEPISAALEDLPQKIDFNLHVKPVLSDRCFKCHGPDANERKAGLRLDLAESALRALPENPGKYAIRPGNIRASQLVQRIISQDPEEQMPPPESGLHLTSQEKAYLIRWIEQGAEYKKHWSLIPPGQVDLPVIDDNEWVRNPIDQFIRAKHEDIGLSAKEEADKEVLFRRVSFDLIGLPPSLAEMDSFLMDPSPAAYEKVVDRLLSSPHYGERMATDWCDVARFADTHGYTVDRYRDMSPWRDWVIRSFKENMPFDQFVLWQLAGDQLPNPSRDQILATGFNRNHQQNMEGGIVPEEFRVEYVADRTHTFGTAFMGMTMECARCHDHKFDPISQKEYYQLFSFFNNVNESGQISFDDAMPVPTLLLTTEKVDSIQDFLSRQIVAMQVEIAEFDNHRATQDLTNGINELAGFFRSDGLPLGVEAQFELDRLPIRDRIHGRKGSMKQQFVSTPIEPTQVKSYRGKGLELDGDAWLDLSGAGKFERHQPFSVGIWINIPEGLNNGVIFHKGDGAIIYNFRGYHLALKDGRIEMMLAHTAPDNAIIKHADGIEAGVWTHLMMTYDGSSDAAGLRLYENGVERETEVVVNNLYKTIQFGRDPKDEPGIQVGARWRGVGIKGAQIDDIVVFARELTRLEIQQVYDHNTLAGWGEVNVNDMTDEQSQLLREFFSTHHTDRQRIESEMMELRRELNQLLDTVQEVMIMKEMPEPRPTYLLHRGQYDQLREQVFPATPEQILAFPEQLPKNRLGLAAWLTSTDHPLTARVTVNRIWQLFFGRGLVATTEDFGNQGQMPSHPELLDWLAVEFMESGWNVKQLIRLIVTSATYRQSSMATDHDRQHDPENVYLARGPSRRLSAEMLRDNVLAASGLLVRRIGGPSVRPYQPEGLYSIQGTTYQVGQGEELYRRSMYTLWKRTIPNPTQSIFDAPTRSNCTVRRQQTSTPLQSLVLMNDPIFLEAAKVLGGEITIAMEPSTAISTVFRRVTGRSPHREELALLLEQQRAEIAKFRDDSSRWKGLLATGNYPNPKDIDSAELAANTVVASTIINMDATLVKR